MADAPKPTHAEHDDRGPGDRVDHRAALEEAIRRNLGLGPDDKVHVLGGADEAAALIMEMTGEMPDWDKVLAAGEGGKQVDPLDCQLMYETWEELIEKAEATRDFSLKELLTRAATIINAAHNRMHELEEQIEDQDDAQEDAAQGPLS